jgi:hypothetical protein
LIPASFSYHRPAALAEALKILSDHGDDARVLAGGHSLIPMMKMRMANIPHLIDLQDIPDLAQISLEGNRVVIGAMVTQAQLINDQTLASAAPLMKTMRYSQILNCHAYSVSRFMSIVIWPSDPAQILHENVQILAAAEHITFNFASASSGGKRPSPQSGATTRRSRSI